MEKVMLPVSRRGYPSSQIRDQILPLAAEFLQNTAYGLLWKIRGTLKGSNGVTIRVVTIWMDEKYTGMTKFITLFPDKEG